VNSKPEGLAIIFHSGSYDRLYHGLSLALAASALGREVKCFFTYWALEYLKRERPSLFELDQEAEAHLQILEENVKRGHLPKISEHLAEAKTLGARLYVCTNSMALLNISRDELIEEVDKSMGLTTFLTETRGDQVLFI